VFGTGITGGRVYIYNDSRGAGGGVIERSRNPPHRTMTKTGPSPWPCHWEIHFQGV